MKPILFLIFNRFDQTKLVFDEIRKYKPSQFFIAADGPRENKKETEICNEIRNYVLDNIDWQCEIHTLFREENLGCGKAVSSSISWFFDYVEDGIILEDDCLPSKHFFVFCEQMLELYKSDYTVMHISGFNYFGDKLKLKNNHFLSNLPSIWGWATWKRAWINYDYDLNFINEENIDFFLSDFVSNDYNQREFWNGKYRLILNNQISTWDIQWLFSIWNKNGLCVFPNKNLIKNIGFTEDALHTTNLLSPFSKLEASTISLKPKKNKIRSNKKLTDFIFYFAHFEVFDLKLNDVKKLKLRLDKSLLSKLKSKKFTFRDKIHLIKEYIIKWTGLK